MHFLFIGYVSLTAEAALFWAAGSKLLSSIPVPYAKILKNKFFSDISNTGDIITYISQSSKTFHVTINKEGDEILSNPIIIPDSVSLSTSNSTKIYKDSLIINSLQYYYTPTEPCCSSIQLTDSLGNFRNEIILPLNFDALTTDFEITFDNKILAVTTYDPLGKKIMLTKYNENFEYDSIYTRPYTYDSLCPGGITSGNIDLGWAIITGIQERKGQGPAGLTLAPNPAKEYTVVYLPESIAGSEKQGPFEVTTFRTDYVKALKMEVYDLHGRLVHQTSWPDGIKEQVLNTSDFTPGLYLIRINSPKGTISTGKLLINK